MAKASSNVTQIMKKEGTRNIGELIKRLYLDTRLSTYLYDLINTIGHQYYNIWKKINQYIFEQSEKLQTLLYQWLQH